MTSAQASRSGGVFLPPTGGLRGTVRVPGDKSISHRAVLLGAVSSQPVEIVGFLRSADTLASVKAIRSLGVVVDETDDGLLVHGVGWSGLSEPTSVIDVANSGTLIRLLPGLIAGQNMLCVLTGDESIRRRPMARILEPLASMGVHVEGRAGGTLPPICVKGDRIQGKEHNLRIASAQVKSCLLLAGLQAEGPTSISEPAVSRDHTERMLRQAGARVEREGPIHGPGTTRVWPTETLGLSHVHVPGDFSSAAFFIVAALIVPGSEVTIEGVGLNPTRIGLVQVLQRMGADLHVEVQDADAPEPIGAVTARYSELTATDVDPAEVPALIDELPAFMLAAGAARGTSTVTGAAELRVKESDRLAAMATLLRNIGLETAEQDDGLRIQGDPAAPKEGAIQSLGDHRLAMVGAVAGCASSDGVHVDDVECVNISFPGFVDILSDLGGRWRPDY